MVFGKKGRSPTFRTETKPFLPFSPPPAAAPPPPPPSDSDDESVRTIYFDTEEHENKYSSYQNNSFITNYGTSSSESEPLFGAMNSGMRGDPSLNPNTGQTNDEIGGIGSLREVASTLRWMTVTSTILCMIWEGFAFPNRLLIQAWIEPAKVVLGGYLGVFCLLLMGAELNAPLRDNFGILYHPLGRGGLLFLMSGMCFGVLAEWWEVLLGLAFLACSLGYIYAYIKYPEYRKWQDYNDNRVWQEVNYVIGRRSVDWARPTGSNASRAWYAAQQESRSLMHNV